MYVFIIGLALAWNAMAQQSLEQKYDRLIKEVESTTLPAQNRLLKMLVWNMQKQIGGQHGQGKKLFEYLALHTESDMAAQFVNLPEAELPFYHRTLGKNLSSYQMILSYSQGEKHKESYFIHLQLKKEKVTTFFKVLGSFPLAQADCMVELQGHFILSKYRSPNMSYDFGVTHISCPPFEITRPESEGPDPFMNFAYLYKNRDFFIQKAKRRLARQNSNK